MESNLRKYYMLVVVTLGFVVVGVSLFSYSIIASLVSGELKLSNTDSGLLTSAFGITYALMQIPAGLASDRVGGGKVLLVSLLVVTVAPLLFIFGNTFSMALLSRAMAGAGSGMILPASIRQISSWFPAHDLNRAMGVFGSGWGGSQVLTYAFLPLLIAGSDWRPPLYFGAVFTLAVTLMAVLPARWSPPRSATQAARVKVEIWGIFTRNFFALMLPNLANLLVIVGVLAWIPLFLTAKLGLTQVASGQMVAIVGLVSVAASYAGGFGAQKFGGRIIILISMLLLVLCPYLLAISGSWVVAAFWVAGLGAGGSLYFPPVMALIPYASKQGQAVAGATFGVFNTLSNIGSFVGPLIVGYVLDSTGSFLEGFTILGALAVSGIIGAFLIQMKYGRRVVAPPS